MDLVRPLAGMDAHPWHSFTHAYGSAEDMPDLLRALTGTDGDAADEALSELYGCVLHQGTVYAASAEAVPFLARIAAAGHRTADVLELLGGMAESEDEYGLVPGAVRAADGNEPWQLTNLLAGWGADAAPALPELCAALPHRPSQAARAIASVAEACALPDRTRAVGSLRAAEQGVLHAAKALYTLVGEPALLLSCLEQELRGGRDLRGAAAAVGPLGSRGAALAPVLREALGRSEGDTTPALDTDTALAEALWRVTADADGAVAVPDSVLARAEHSPWSRWSVVRAARAAALLGPAGRPLAARLEAALGDPVQAPAAVVALMAVADPASLDRTALAELALRSAEQDADPSGACDALEALGFTALTADHLRRVDGLADGDTRVVRSGVEDRIVHQDEALRIRARRLALTFHAGGSALRAV
ncbi:hypothetical protein [Streptomyces sp. AB3(2024)]|uniref:hypothetical protein n=1 Tax=Streptomyces sp. AB3(2024) TaxID=3317321 RepID=UPI0035A2A180